VVDGDLIVVDGGLIVVDGGFIVAVPRPEIDLHLGSLILFIVYWHFVSPVMFLQADSTFAKATAPEGLPHRFLLPG